MFQNDLGIHATNFVWIVDARRLRQNRVGQTGGSLHAQGH